MKCNTRNLEFHWQNCSNSVCFRSWGCLLKLDSPGCNSQSHTSHVSIQTNNDVWGRRKAGCISRPGTNTMLLTDMYMCILYWILVVNALIKIEMALLKLSLVEEQLHNLGLHFMKRFHSVVNYYYWNSVLLLAG